jgi:hypothetical protein
MIYCVLKIIPVTIYQHDCFCVFFFLLGTNVNLHCSVLLYCQCYPYCNYYFNFKLYIYKKTCFKDHAVDIKYVLTMEQKRKSTFFFYICWRLCTVKPVLFCYIECSLLFFCLQNNLLHFWSLFYLVIFWFCKLLACHN